MKTLNLKIKYFKFLSDSKPTEEEIIFNVLD
jgi:hypothetical protein